jgi:GalNAc5-diNAcBac-PP-undecaprenol beta-1,3-glucosyltransferase
MNTAPRVSVAIATYRRAALVPRAIRSALAQTLTDIEVIVVDDGSPDDTAASVQAIGDARMRYLRHERNRGLPAARNTAIRAARGRYVAFLDDDDQWMPDKLERQLSALRHHKALLCAELMSGPGTVRRFPRDVVYADDLRKGNRFAPSGLIVETELMKQLLFDETLRVGEDWDAFIRLAQRAPIGYLREPLVIYDTGLAGRMTAEAASLSVADLDRRMSVVHKHRVFFGSFWFRVHVAAFLLSHLGRRPDRFARLWYAVRRCGVLPVARLLWERAKTAAQRRFPGRRPLALNG